MPRPPRLAPHRWLALPAAAFVAGACGGGKDLSITATGKLDGSFVVITATCSIYAQVEAAGISADCSPDKPLTLRVPAQKIGSGKQTVAVSASGAGKQAKAELSVDIPAAATGPYFVVTKCGGDSGEFLDLKDGERTFDCHTSGGARVQLSVQGSPGGKLTLGGKAATLPESGQLDLGVDLSEGILGLSIDDLLSDASQGPQIGVPWKLEAAGKSIDGKLTASVKFGSHKQVMWQWLQDLTAGKIDRPAFQPRAEGRKTALRVPTEKFSKIGATDRRGTVREVALLAVEREAKRAKAGTCQFDSSGKVVTATRYDIEIEVKVIGTADGKPVTTKSFPAPAACPMFAMMRPDKPEVTVRVDDADVMKWLDTLTEPGASDAAGGAAPEAGGGAAKP